VSGPAGPFDRALVEAFRPPQDVRIRSDAGFRLRARVAHRHAQQAALGLTGGLVLLAVVVLTVGSVLHGRLTTVPATASGGMATASGGMGMRAGDLPVLPWAGASSSPLGPTYGQSRLTHPLEVVGVESVVARRCTAAVTQAMDSGLAAPDHACSDLTRPAVLVVRRPLAVEVTRTAPSGGTGVAVTLGESDSRTLLDYTSRHVGSRIAFVVADRVWWAAEISRPVDTGVIEIATGSTEADAVKLVESLGPRTVAKPRWVPMPW
jgi:hypothetical protein